VVPRRAYAFVSILRRRRFFVGREQGKPFEKGSPCTLAKTSIRIDKKTDGLGFKTVRFKVTAADLATLTIHKRIAG